MVSKSGRLPVIRVIRIFNIVRQFDTHSMYMFVV